jgi:hypothetical protein
MKYGWAWALTFGTVQAGAGAWALHRAVSDYALFHKVEPSCEAFSFLCGLGGFIFLVAATVLFVSAFKTIKRMPSHATRSAS